MLADERIHGEGHLGAARPHDHQVDEASLVRFERSWWVAQGVVELLDRDDSVAQRKNVVAADSAERPRFDAQRLDDTGERQSADSRARLDEQGADDRQRQRQRQRNLRPHSERARDIDPPAQALDVVADDVHADATAGNLGDHTGRREAWQEDDSQDVVVAR